VRYFQTKSLQPPVYVRCLIQSLILSEMRVLDRMSIKQLLYCDLEEITLPASVLVDPTSDEYEAPQHPRFQINAKMETLISRSADVSFVCNSSAGSLTGIGFFRDFPGALYESVSIATYVMSFDS
jgi:hypothetical protein